MTTHAEGKGQSRSEQTLCLQLRLILSTETICKDQKIKQINKNNNKKQQTPGKGVNLIFRVTTFLDSNVQYSIKNKNQKAYKEIGEYGPVKKKKQRSTETP